MTDTEPTTDPIEATVGRYFGAWNETEDDARPVAVASAFATDARYVDPLSDAAGHDQIAAAMGEAHRQYPGITVRRTTPIDAHHDVIRFGWEITGSDGAVLVDGIDVARVDDGLLADVRGFFGQVTG